jgi:hypothetical protein
MKRAFKEQGVDETLQNQIGPALTRVAEGLRNRDGR